MAKCQGHLIPSGGTTLPQSALLRRWHDQDFGLEEDCMITRRQDIRFWVSGDLLLLLEAEKGYHETSSGSRPNEIKSTSAALPAVRAHD